MRRGREGPRPAGRSRPVPGWPAESAQRLEKARALRRRGASSSTRRASSGATAWATSWPRTGRRPSRSSRRSASRSASPGRVLTKRGHGKASFATLGDGEARLQVYVRADEVGEEAYRLLDLVDLGDFVGVEGTVMRTRKGELSVQAREIVVLSKALLPPPEKWHGLADVEVRYRQRYLDLMANPEVRRVFVVRSAMVASMRRFLDERGYVEVETPMMQPIAGGAVARPFVTHHNALGHRPLPAHRPGALPEAAGGGRLRAGLRDQPELPERGHLLDAQPGVHHARVLHRLLRLPRRHGDHRGARGARRRGSRARGASRYRGKDVSLRRALPRACA